MQPKSSNPLKRCHTKAQDGVAILCFGMICPSYLFPCYNPQEVRGGDSWGLVCPNANDYSYTALLQQERYKG